MREDPLTRRRFLKTGAAETAVAGAAGLLGAPAPVRAANLNARLRVGFIGSGGRANTHLGIVLGMQREGVPVEAAAVCDVYNLNLDRFADRIEKTAGGNPRKSGDYRDLLNDPGVDAVVIATPDHWHARHAIDALEASKHVYCEKPMTHTAGEARLVEAAWRKSRKVMQVGVQRTSDGRWKAANRFIREGRIGKVVQAQSEYFRNSRVGQWRYYKLEREMTPKNIDWKMFLGTEFGLAPEMPFDRALFRQWPCYWQFSSGPFANLFVHRLTPLLVALGVRYPRRVVGGGGIFLEYDGRQVPDTATVVADYDAGLQVFLTATMVNARPIEQCIRGHYGTVVFDLAKDGFDVEPALYQITRSHEPANEHVAAPRPDDETRAHWENFLEAIARDAPEEVNNPPDLGAAASATLAMATESYRNGQVVEWNASEGKVVPGGPGYAAGWEEMSKERSAPRHVPGWAPTNQDPLFSRQVPGDHQKLEGPWPDDQTDPAAE